MCQCVMWIVQKTSEANFVSAYPKVVPTTFRDVFCQLVHQLLWSDGKICGRPLCFMVKSCVIHCFRLRFSHLNQSMDQLGTVFIAKSELFQGDSGDSWPPLDAGLGQCFEGSWSVYLKTNLRTFENKKLFSAAVDEAREGDRADLNSDWGFKRSVWHRMVSQSIFETCETCRRLRCVEMCYVLRLLRYVEICLTTGASHFWWSFNSSTWPF